MLPTRLLAPRATLSIRARQIRSPEVSRRHASSTPPKPRLLEKPERFNPPSHPARIKTKPKYYGPGLSETERQAQKTRRYPNMMPAEGTFLHWFLTNRTIHTIIPIGILVGITFTIWYTEFTRNTPYLDLLPPNSMFFAHPFAFFRRWFQVYGMHVQYVSEKTAEKRKQQVDDVQKRSEYRKAHGLEEDGKIGSWTARSDLVLAGGSASENTGRHDDASPIASNADGNYTGPEGTAIASKKKVFGLW